MSTKSNKSTPKGQYPHAVIDGHDVAQVNDTLNFDGDLALCSCAGPGEATVTDTDFSSVSETYYVETPAIRNCCGGYWVAASLLHYVTPPTPPFDITKAPLATQLVVHLDKKVADDDITVADLKKALSEVKRLLVEEITGGSSKQFKGMCSACMTDVHIVGGALEHVDKRACLTPAVLVTS